MIKAKGLKKGDRIAVVSLSWGGLGDEEFIHKYYIGKERLEKEFGLEVVPMPHALKGSEFVAKHPELRAKDLMDAFEDPSISAIFCAIGGDDTIRTLPYIDINVIRNNPKIFMGYSDTTINHLMMYKAGLVSFYGPSLMCEFGEYVSMFEYTKAAVRDVFMMCIGTKIWPTLDKWEGAILFIETSEDKPSPDFVKWTFRNLAAQGILKAIEGIIVGKPQDETYYDEYKDAMIQVVREEEGLKQLPILYNVNIGHASPIGILPYGIKAELDCDKKTITLLENATKTP
jgi:muramoyltetrapeptide carboxypeptidase LdcA involved in peptidoglycan recycling